jgi:hypothetical protein
MSIEDTEGKAKLVDEEEHKRNQLEIANTLLDRIEDGTVRCFAVVAIDKDGDPVLATSLKAGDLLPIMGTTVLLQHRLAAFLEDVGGDVEGAAEALEHVLRSEGEETLN